MQGELLVSPQLNQNPPQRITQGKLGENKYNGIVDRM